MAYELRPLSFGEILDRAFRVLLDNFLLFVGIAIFVWVPDQIMFASRSVIGRVPADLIVLAIVLTARPVMQGALITAIASVYLARPTSISDAYRSVRPIVVPLLKTYFLFFLAFAFALSGIGGTVAFTVMMVTQNTLIFAPFALPALAIFLVGMYFVTSWCLLGSVMIVERLFGSAALRRSKVLVRNVWWPTFGVMITAAVITAAPTATLRFVWGFIPIVGVVFSGLMQAIGAAYGAAVFVIYYFDRRCRMEEFDIRLLANQIRSETGSIAPASASSPA